MYKNNPTSTSNLYARIQSFPSFTKEELLECSESLKETGLIHKFEKGEDFLFSKITLEGIEAISNDLQEMTDMVLSDLMERGNHLSLIDCCRFRMIEQMDKVYEGKLYCRVKDFAEYLAKRNLITFRLIERRIGKENVIVKITSDGIKRYQAVTSSTQPQPKTRFPILKSSTGWKYYFENRTVREERKLRSVGRFDERENHIEQLFYNDEGEVENSFKLSYDDENNPVSGEVFISEGSDLIGKLISTFEVRGNVTIGTYLTSFGEVFWYEEYLHDANGNLIEKKRTDNSGKFISRTTYKYNEAGKRISSVEYNFTSKVESFYDEDGFETHARVSDADGNVSGNYEYVVDEYGNMDEEIRLNIFNTPLYLIKYENEYY